MKIDVSIEAKTKIAVIQQKIVLWKNTHYSATLDAQIAKTIGDDRMLEQTKTNMKQALQVLDELNKILAEIDGS